MEDMEQTETAVSIPKPDESPNTPVRSCALCGCSTPAVRCDRCNSQIFCLSCDDMYHKHPKRKLHLRKAVDSIWSSSRSPRLRRRTDLPGDPSKIPIPPPRTKKRDRHTICGRPFLKPGYELGSLGFHRTFDMKNFVQSPSPDIFAGQKSPVDESNYENDRVAESLIKGNGKPEEIYENDDAALHQEMNLNFSDSSREPWNSPKPNISPIQVAIPSTSPNAVTNGRSLGFPPQRQGQAQSLSSADLRTTSPHLPGPHPYHFPHPYPYMHHPGMHPYANSMAHLHCNQCLSSSWSSLMSPYPGPFFHQVPWGASPHAAMSGGHPAANMNGHGKHSHGDLVNSPEPNFQHPYPEAGFPPQVFDPNFMRDFQQHQSEMQRLKKSPASSVRSRSMEDIKSPASDDPKHDIAESSVSPDGQVATRQGGAKAVVEDVEPPLPEKPTEPWSCVHCTFINPPGDYICQVCCKTSYRIESLKDPEEQARSRFSNRDSESPMELINNDAIVQNANMDSSHRETGKVM